MAHADGFYERKCARCGKVFIKQPFHVYKHKEKWFCSYHCYDEHLNEYEQNIKKRGRKKRNEQ